MLAATARRQRAEVPYSRRWAARSIPPDQSAGPGPQTGQQQAELAVLSVNRMNVLAVGVLLQVVLTRYAGMGHIVSYTAQAVVCAQLGFLLSRFLARRDRNMPVMRAAATFNIQQVIVTALGIVSYAWLERHGLNYITANVAVTAALTPASVAAGNIWIPRTPQRESRISVSASDVRAGPSRKDHFGSISIRQEIAIRRAKVIIALSAGAIGTGCLLYALGRNWLTGALLMANLFNLAVATLEAHWRFYALRNPEAAKKLAWPEPIQRVRADKLHLDRVRARRSRGNRADTGRPDPADTSRVTRSSCRCAIMSAPPSRGPGFERTHPARSKW